MKFCILMLPFILASCVPSFEKTTLNFDDGSIVAKPLVADGDTVTFEVLKEKLLLPHCIQCHRKIGEEERLLKWVVQGRSEESELYQVVKDGSMPKDGTALDERYLDLIRRYIEQTRKEPVPTEPLPTEPVPTEPDVVTFEIIKKDIIDQSCIGCHKKMVDEASILKWIKPGNSKESLFYQVLEDGRMPKKADKLPEAQLALVRKYIDSMKTPVDPMVPSFENLKNEVIVPSCLGCHKKMGDEANIQKWIVPGNPKESEFYQVVENGSMPKMADKLAQDKLDLIARYIESLKTP